MPAVFGQPITYYLQLNDEVTPLNPLLGYQIHLKKIGLRCIHCHKAIKKTYNQGYCYPCFIKLAECDLCILKPHTCHYAQGTCREPTWGEQFCFQPHFVYLANSSGLKVGITRASNIPDRWIDQGATQALTIFKVASRHIAGLIEMVFAQHISDKTHWQQLLKKQAEPVDLPAERDRLLSLCADGVNNIIERFGADCIEWLATAETVNLTFPVQHHPSKIKSLDFDKTPEISGTLQGIKGQYLLLDSGVLNIRKYTGYEIEFST